ncbi:uncharacterized protein [Argopecten irradians]|uniref:uncharacterized protein n=1 Tax=Argopecten irradians TaxID=31199 RepID=UPI00371C5FF9
MTDMIQLFVRSGSNRNTIIEVHKDASVDDLVSKITEWNGIDEASQRVLFAGRELQMVKDLKDRSHLFVVFQLPGGNDPDAQEEPFGNSNYGNDVCTDEDPILKILKEAPLKEIVGLKGCPSIRACPKCGSLIEHIKDCKHMVCVCGQEFCFICLNKPGAYSNYCCGFFKCTIAPIQDMIGITDEG